MGRETGAAHLLFFTAILSLMLVLSGSVMLRPPGPTASAVMNPDVDARVHSAGSVSRQETFPAAQSTNRTYYVGAQAQEAICAPDVVCTFLTNSGARTTIQVVSQEVNGCLSYWIGDDSGANIWGQVGYYICDGSTPVAFYQIWNLDTYSILTTGVSAISPGYHQFSMYVDSGTTWAYAVDGNVTGTYDMGANSSMPTYPVQALSEEGYVSAPWVPAPVTFSSAIQTFNSGVWTPAEASTSYGGDCNSDGSPGKTGYYAPYSCWGAQGNLQNSTIPTDAFVVGGNVPLILSGSPLWNGAASPPAATTTESSTSASSASFPTAAAASNHAFRGLEHGTLRIV